MPLHIPLGPQTRLKDLLPLIAGSLLLLGLVCILNGCATVKKDNPPEFPICMGDGVGGADCIGRPDCTPIPGHDGKTYCPPSKLNTAWITTQEGAQALTQWCYDIDKASAQERVQSWLEFLKKGQ